MIESTSYNSVFYAEMLLSAKVMSELLYGSDESELIDSDINNKYINKYEFNHLYKDRNRNPALGTRDEYVYNLTNLYNIKYDDNDNELFYYKLNYKPFLTDNLINVYTTLNTELLTNKEFETNSDIMEDFSLPLSWKTIYTTTLKDNSLIINDPDFRSKVLTKCTSLFPSDNSVSSLIEANKNLHTHNIAINSCIDYNRYISYLDTDAFIHRPVDISYLDIRVTHPGYTLYPHTHKLSNLFNECLLLSYIDITFKVEQGALNDYEFSEIFVTQFGLDPAIVENLSVTTQNIQINDSYSDHHTETKTIVSGTLRYNIGNNTIYDENHILSASEYENTSLYMSYKRDLFNPNNSFSYSYLISDLYHDDIYLDRKFHFCPGTYIYKKIDNWISSPGMYSPNTGISSYMFAADPNMYYGSWPKYRKPDDYSYYTNNVIKYNDSLFGVKILPGNNNGIDISENTNNYSAYIYIQRIDVNYKLNDKYIVTYVRNNPNINKMCNNIFITMPKYNNEFNYTQNSSSCISSRNVYITDSTNESHLLDRFINKKNIVNDINNIEIISKNYNPYKYEYFTIKVLNSGTISFSINNRLQYSKNNGSWTNLTLSGINCSTYDIIRFRLNSGQSLNLYDSIGTFSGTASIKVYGNIMSLLYNTDDYYMNNTTPFILEALFKNHTNLVDAQNLYLPIQIAGINLYKQMFYSCTSLINAPKLPATQLASSCYKQMFYGCTSLINAPELPATNLSLADECYYEMFAGCTSLTTAPTILPATNLPNKCYYGMFKNCTSLTTSPELPAKTLYYETRITTDGPTMIGGATPIQIELVSGQQYEEMFYGCSSLNYIKCSLVGIINLRSARRSTLDTNNDYCLNNWVYGVANRGTFVQEYTASWLIGSDGIPFGWYVEYNNQKYNSFRIKVLSGSGTIEWNSYFNNNELTYSGYMRIGGILSPGGSISVNENDIIYFYGNNLSCDFETGIGTFIINNNIECEISGNIMSLYYGDNFIEQTDLSGKDYIFYRLFDNCSGIVSAENLILPATTLAAYCYGYMFNNCASLTTTPKILPATTLTEGCYEHMFYGCTSLPTIPELPAITLAWGCYGYMFGNCTSLTTAPELPTTLVGGCYSGMFYNCTSLTTAPALPATTLASYCYNSMFDGCTSLQIAPELPATTLESYCYYSMFRNCTALISAPVLPATTLAQYCYNSMFNGCTSLTTATELPATTLAYGCYESMFYSCISLIKAPELPATTLIGDCYKEMFRNCISLISAPELPATTLADYCYASMFYGCTLLNYIKCLATNISASSCTSNWVYDVAATGTFVKNETMYFWTNGINGIPIGWNQKNDTIYENQYLTFEVIDNDTRFGFESNLGMTYSNIDKIQYNINNQGWTFFDESELTPELEAGDLIQWKMTNPANQDTSSDWGSSGWGIGHFTATGRYNVYGNIMSLLYGDNFQNKTSLANFGENVFMLLFGCDYINETTTDVCYNLISAKNLILPATELTNDCYEQMFASCVQLLEPPKILPTTTLVYACYYAMFINCTSLITTPELPATTLEIGCYSCMFKGCTSLTKTPELPATTLANGCYAQMFLGCTSLTTAPELPATTLAKECYQQMFLGCSSLIVAPALPATTLAIDCYDEMFKDCTSLFNVPTELPATTLRGKCYQRMFMNCTSLKTAPELPATTLANDCYDRMFSGCSSLTNVQSELPATTLNQKCYQHMFFGCTSLTEAPELPAQTLAVECYNHMFQNCISLEYIKCSATDISASKCTTDWVNGVGNVGRFIGYVGDNVWHDNNNNIIHDNDHVPIGWDFFGIV